MVEDLWKASSLTSTAYAEGEAEGEVRGERKGLREAIQGVLESRFGLLSQEVTQALNRADEATLKRLVTHVASDTLEQVRQRLG